jgi:putative phage-type endonuclease
MTPEEREAWLQARCGKVGASMIHAIMARTKSGYSASRDNYMSDLLIERLTGRPTETYQSEAMLHGINTEPQAKAFYELETGNQVVNVGFMLHPEITEAGASPDGLIGDDGLIEVKCKNTANHIDFLLNEKIEQKHIYQMQWQMACTGRQWCDYTLFDCRVPTSMQLKIKRVFRCDDTIKEIEQEVVKFLFELDTKLKELKERYC